MTNKERLIKLIDDFGDDVALCDVCNRPREDCEGCTNEQLAEYLLENGVIVLPCKLNLPDELYRYMFDDDHQPIVVKCKVVKITGYGFTLKHPADGREWEYKYNSLGYTVFLTKEETDERIKALKGGVTNE